jgi:hypothetical protein
MDKNFINEIPTWRYGRDTRSCQQLTAKEAQVQVQGMGGIIDESSVIRYFTKSAEFGNSSNASNF